MSQCALTGGLPAAGTRRRISPGGTAGTEQVTVWEALTGGLQLAHDGVAVQAAYLADDALQLERTARGAAPRQRSA